MNPEKGKLENTFRTLKSYSIWGPRSSYENGAKSQVRH